MSEMIAVGICPHGIILAAIKVAHAEDDELRDFASAHKHMELRETVSMGGNCHICQEQYEKNCKLLGVEA